MALVRIIHPDEYDPRDNRFISTAFEPSSDGSGISVFDRDCATLESQSACGHARYYYRSLIPENPPLTFFLWNVPTLPEGCTVVQEVFDDGRNPPDRCHNNIKGISKGSAKSFFKREHWKDVGGGVRVLTGFERCGPPLEGFAI